MNCNALYKAFYRCRLCGEEFTPVSTRNRSAVVREVVKACSLKEPETMSLTINKVHYCDNGSIGIADFIGFRRESVQE